MVLCNWDINIIRLKKFFSIMPVLSSLIETHCINEWKCCRDASPYTQQVFVVCCHMFVYFFLKGKGTRCKALVSDLVRICKCFTIRTTSQCHGILFFVSPCILSRSYPHVSCPHMLHFQVCSVSILFVRACFMSLVHAGGDGISRRGITDGCRH